MDNKQDNTPASHSNLPKLQVVIALLVSLAIALIYMLEHVAPMDPGLDSSWAYGLNYTFQHDLVLGKDIYFTFGPLGFFEHTRTLTLNMVNASVAFWFACSIVMNFIVLMLCCKTANSRLHLAANLGLALLLILFANTQIQRLLILVYASVLFHWHTRNTGVLLLLSLSCVLALLIKFSHGAVTLGLFLPYLLAASWRDRNHVTLLIGAGSLPVFYLAIWYGIYGGFAGATGYLQGGLEFSRGSTSASALNPANNWFAIAGFYGAFLGGIFLMPRDLPGDNNAQKLPNLQARLMGLVHHIILPACFMGPLFIWSKYAFGREDGPHLAPLMNFVIYVCILWAMMTRTTQNKLTCVLIIPLCHFFWHYMQTPETGPAELMDGAGYFSGDKFSDRWNNKRLVDIMNTANIEKLAPLRLSTDLRNTIANSPVDTYPWETLIAAANDLNWTPRPVYQNYISYTPFLDRANQQFYDGKLAPDFLVWHHHSFADIDTRYPFSSDPLTLQAILQHYKMLRCDEQFCLWQHTATEQASVAVDKTVSSAAWDEWIAVPPSQTDVIRLHLDVRRTLAGKLNLALWKEGGIEIDYRLRDGSIKTHGVVIDNATSGLWASPYLDRIYQYQTSLPQAIDSARLQQSLQAAPAEGYIEKAEQTPGGIHVVGWGLLPFKASNTQRLSLLFYNDKNAYKVTVANKNRPGITAHFGKTGIVDLDACGFDEIIPVRNMAAGDYKVQFIVKNENEVAVSTQSPTLVTISHDSSLNVEAVRLRTTRPWAFSKTLSMHWSTLTFTGDRPW
jgi:hypothetical protein